MTLSDCIIDDLRGGGALGILKEDVKEFIKKLKKKLIFEGCFPSIVNREIDKIAGKELI